MTNPNPPLIPNEYCIRHKRYYPASDWCTECEIDLELDKMLDNIRRELIKLKEFIYEYPQYNMQIIADYDIDKMIKIISNAISNLDI